MPVVLIVIISLAVLPLIFWLFASGVLSMSDVRGSSSSADVKQGFSVEVKSSNEAWDLIVYACASLDECAKSFDSGKKLVSLSGSGARVATIDASSEWEGYTYIKYYVTPSWFGSGAVYAITDLGEVAGSEMHEMSDGGSVYKVVIIPVGEVVKSFKKSATFTLAEDSIRPL